jgi:glucose-6-phosphate isomerase
VDGSKNGEGFTVSRLTLTSLKVVHFTQSLTKDELTSAKNAVAALLKRQDLGFWQLPAREKVWKSSQERGEEVRRHFKKLNVLGIGGSSLGGITIRESLNLNNLEFFENVDAKDFWDQVHAIKDFEDIHWAIISKSGKTVETLTQANFIHELLKSKGLSLAQNATVISETRANPLSNWAEANKVPVLGVPEDVGGRFSVLSPVGLFPAAFGGADLEQMRLGAASIVENPGLSVQLTAHFLKSFSDEKWITVLWPYCNRLKSFGLWYEQLWAESLGKKLNRKGGAAPRASTPISLVGACDQHSVLQQISEGAKDKFVTFLRVAESENAGPRLKENLFEGEDFVIGKTMGQLLAAEATATREALEVAGVPSLSLEIGMLDAGTLGALFMLMEIVVGSIGEAHDINAFDQPGVELGKRLAKEILLK